MIIDATKKPARGLGIETKEGRFAFQVSRFKSVDEKILDINLIDDTLLIVKVDFPGSHISNPTSHIGKDILQKLVALPELNMLKLIAVVSSDVDIHDKESYIWGVFTRFDCERDVIFTENKLVGISPVYTGVMGIDATWKPGYPKPLVMIDEIINRVDEKWGKIWKS
jgi:4-hydroxy-3-polyprenylbenzoate decarboxylase